MLITGARVLTPQGMRQTSLLIKEGKLHVGAESGSEEVLDASGCMVLPGFLDIHTHGAYGVDVNAADVEGLERIGRFMASQGTTGWLCSILTDTEEQTLWCIEQASRLIGRQYGGAELLGIHLEGPCLSPEYKGAMPEQLLMKRADLSLFEKYQKAAGGHIRYLTVSPEVKGVSEMIPHLCKMGITVAIGHSGAVYQDAMDCIRAGARSATHMGNAMRLFHQHEPAIFGAALESDVYCEAICDGLHLHPATVRIYLKAKGWDRVIAVTDSIMAAGLPDGKYMLGVNRVEVVNGDAKLEGGGARAGSTLTQLKALHNLVQFTGRPAEECCRLMTANPAALLGLKGKGSIEDGNDADLVILDEKLNLRYTLVGGNIVFRGSCEKQHGGEE